MTYIPKRLPGISITGYMCSVPLINRFFSELILFNLHILKYHAFVSSLNIEQQSINKYQCISYDMFKAIRLKGMVSLLYITQSTSTACDVILRLIDIDD